MSGTSNLSFGLIDLEQASEIYLAIVYVCLLCDQIFPLGAFVGISKLHFSYCKVFAGAKKRPASASYDPRTAAVAPLASHPADPTALRHQATPNRCILAPFFRVYRLSYKYDLKVGDHVSCCSDI